MKRRNQPLQASPETLERVQLRYERLSTPYLAHRRNFTSKRVSQRIAALKAVVWASL